MPIAPHLFSVKVRKMGLRSLKRCFDYRFGQLFELIGRKNVPEANIRCEKDFSVPHSVVRPSESDRRWTKRGE
jgi:hypothetical protein